MLPSSRLSACLLLVLVSCALPAPLSAQQQRALTFTDLMHFKAIEQPTLSDDGGWLAFTARPDRGDGEVVIRAVAASTRYVVPRGSTPAFSSDGGWLTARLDPPFSETGGAEKPEDAPQPGLVLVDLRTGVQTSFPSVERSAFSEDGRWLAYQLFAPRDTSTAEAGSGTGSGTGTDPADEPAKPGTTMVLRELATGRDVAVPFVRHFAFDEAGRYVAYAIADTSGAANGLFVRDLAAGAATPIPLDERPGGHYTGLTWSEATGQLAFLAATADAGGRADSAALWLWDGRTAREVHAAAAAPDGWLIPPENTLTWTDDGRRLFFGYRPVPTEAERRAPDSTRAADPYDVEALLADREVDVWHWNDPRILPHQKQRWKEEQQRTYRAVYHAGTGQVVQLGDLHVQGTDIPQNERFMLGRADGPYLKEITWDGTYFDLYVVGLADGTRTRVAERLQGTASLSPGGRFAAYYDAGHWYLYDTEAGTTRNVTQGLGVPFANEDHDYPQEAPGYGLGGWIAGDAAVLIYDKYDVWQVPTGEGLPVNLTGGEGRTARRVFRVVRTDPEQDSFEPGAPLLLSAYHDVRKHYGFYRAHAGQAGATPLLEEDQKFSFIAQAEDAGVLLYAREDYDEFPDLWTAGPDFASPRRLTDLNAQLAPFAWGTSELVEWTSLDGLPLQGVVIKPGNYEPGRRYPVLVYFYRFFSQRLHEFNQPVVNHRPSFPLYASNGYLIFLPDVRFEVGQPGFSATKCILPGVQKLIDLGLADPDALGLHGHSWSGYQTAFIVTQTDRFAAAVAGAPVSNMTSAYSGIRWGSGLARQFQYEQSQSRLGASLWEARDRYIDNSPVFFADRINTPLLIMFGDEDGAVPWYQGIELYLALRRLGKEAVFLQYRGEDHHLAKYANKLDYAMKMKAFFDHYLKGEPAPAWLEKGIPYAGE